MSKSHVAMYRGTGGVPNARVKAAISIAAGKRKAVKVPVISSEGRVTHLSVQQASGTAKAFTVELLSSLLPYPEGEQNYNAATGANVAAFRILPQMTALVNGVVEFFDSFGQDYLNLDQVSQTDNQRYVVLVIIPTNTVDTTTWEVSLLTELNMQL
jgi:hypothetical protein